MRGQPAPKRHVPSQLNTLNTSSNTQNYRWFECSLGRLVLPHETRAVVLDAVVLVVLEGGLGAEPAQQVGHAEARLFILRALQYLHVLACNGADTSYHFLVSLL